MKSRILKIMIVLSLIFTMTMTNFIVVGNSFISYALDQFDTNNRKVEFNAYFKNIEGEKVSNLDITTDNLETTLYLYVNIIAYKPPKVKRASADDPAEKSRAVPPFERGENLLVLPYLSPGHERFFGTENSKFHLHILVFTGIYIGKSHGFCPYILLFCIQ